MSQPRTIIEKLWDSHVVAEQPGRSGAALHRPAPGARSHVAAGLRRPARARPEGPPAGPDVRHRRPQHSHHAALAADRRQIAATQVAQLETNCKEFGIPCFGFHSEQQGIVHVIGPEQRLDAARHDRGLRRQPHGDARRVRRAGVRHRHQRSGACAGDAVPAAAQVEDLSGAGRRHAAGRASRRRTSSSS